MVTSHVFQNELNYIRNYFISCKGKLHLFLPIKHSGCLQIVHGSTATRVCISLRKAYSCPNLCLEQTKHPIPSITARMIPLFKMRFSINWRRLYRTHRSSLVFPSNVSRNTVSVKFVYIR